MPFHRFTLSFPLGINGRPSSGLAIKPIGETKLAKEIKVLQGRNSHLFSAREQRGTRPAVRLHSQGPARYAQQSKPCRAKMWFTQSKSKHRNLVLLFALEKRKHILTFYIIPSSKLQEVRKPDAHQVNLRVHTHKIKADLSNKKTLPLLPTYHSHHRKVSPAV